MVAVGNKDKLEKSIMKSLICTLKRILDAYEAAHFEFFQYFIINLINEFWETEKQLETDVLK